MAKYYSIYASATALLLLLRTFLRILARHLCHEPCDFLWNIFATARVSRVGLARVSRTFCCCDVVCTEPELKLSSTCSCAKRDIICSEPELKLFGTCSCASLPTQRFDAEVTTGFLLFLFMHLTI